YIDRVVQVDHPSPVLPIGSSFVLPLSLPLTLGKPVIHHVGTARTRIVGGGVLTEQAVSGAIPRRPLNVRCRLLKTLLALMSLWTPLITLSAIPLDDLIHPCG